MSARYELRRRGVFDRTLGREIGPPDPEWQDWQAALARGDAFDPEPAPPPAPDPSFDPILAGRARETRQLEKLADRDPVTAALVAVGLKRRPTR